VDPRVYTYIGKKKGENVQEIGRKGKEIEKMGSKRVK
jgi:hypothetical protein